jgi:hypothetical protein
MAAYETAAYDMRSPGTLPLVSVLAGKARSWQRKPREEKLLFVPSFLLLGMAQLTLHTVPFRRIAPLLGHDVRTAASVPLADARQAARALHIGRAVRTAACYTPWESKCLAQAMAARALLGMSGLPYGLYLGVGRRGESGVTAHAWVCTGPVAVTGGRSFGRFAVVGAFLSLQPRRPVER